MSGKVRRSVVTLAVLLAVTATRASAHAELVKALPAPNSVVTPAPKGVILWFDEPISLAVSSVQVFDNHQAQVDNSDLALAPNDPKQVAVSLKPLADGTYSVVYKVLSAADGHVTSGSYAFGVGTATSVPVTPGSSLGDQGGAVSVAIRALELWSILVLVGSLFFRDFVLVRSLYEIRAPEAVARANERCQVLVSAAVLLALFSLVLGTGAESILLTNAITLEGSARLVFETRTGILWLVRFLLLVLVALISFQSSRFTGVTFKVLDRCSPVLGLGVLMTLALNSHSSALGDLSVAVFVDWLHSAAVSLWVGGLAAFVWVITPVWRALSTEKRTAWLANLIPAFSRLGVASVGVIIATGFYNAVVNVGGWEALVGTLYGEILSFKVALFALMLVVAAANLFAMRRAFSPAESEETISRRFRVFRNLIAGEAVLGIVVIALAGFLSLTPPARGVLFTRNASTVPARLVLISHPSPDLNIAVTITPTSGAPQSLEATVTNSSNQPATDVLRVIFEFTWLEQDAGSTRTSVDKLENGRYGVSGDFLPMPGMWRLQVVVRRRGVEDVSAAFPFFQSANAAPALVNDPAALDLLRQSDTAMNSLKTLRSVQELNDGQNGSVTTTYQYQAPDRVHLEIASRGESVAVGGNQYYRDNGQQMWKKSPRVDPFVFPAFNNALQAQGARLGRTETLDGIPTQIVVFSTPQSDQQAHLAYWIGTQDRRIHQYFMVAPAHYMVQSYSDYNAPIEINEPSQ